VLHDEAVADDEQASAYVAMLEREYDQQSEEAIPSADDLAAEVLYKAPLAVMANKSHPLVHRSRPKLVDLMEEQWTLPPPESLLGRMVADVFRRRRLALHLRADARSRDRRRHCAAARVRQPARARNRLRPPAAC
jgi:hypothetical protein